MQRHDHVLCYGKENVGKVMFTAIAYGEKGGGFPHEHRIVAGRMFTSGPRSMNDDGEHDEDGHRHQVNWQGNVGDGWIGTVLEVRDV